jgi:hypothetical protein
MFPIACALRYHRRFEEAWMRAIFATAVWSSLFVLAVGCGGKSDDDDDDDDGPDACVGLECQVVNCGAMSLPNTSISGTVFAPNGTLPLNGVTVYINRDPLPPFVEGATCDRCSASLPGSAIAQATSDATGAFRLENVPAGADIPLVITTGKWRRQVTIPAVNQCTDNQVGTSETRLPKNRAEGDIPKIAITTGGADTMECLVRKLGIDDTEIGKEGDDRRIHLYVGDGTDSFEGGFAGGSGDLTSATPFWSSVDSLKAYDITILSCEGEQGPDTKPQPALDAMQSYANLGGRVFASHWHNIWVGGNFQDQGNNPTLSPAEWRPIATWNNNNNGFNNENVDIDEVNNPKGMLFADWMVNVGASPTRGIFEVDEGRATAVSLPDTTKAERWVQRNDQPQMFQFTTPVNVTPDQKCGKVVFTDMHVSGSPQSLDPYPGHCIGGNNLTPQEKALAFMFFDIASCVGGLF